MLEIEGLETLTERLKRCAADVGYLSVTDRSDHRRPDPVGRFDFTQEQVDAYTAVEVSAYGYTIQPETELDVHTPAQIAEVAGRWLKDVIESNAAGSALSRFRVRVYRPKGEGSWSATLLVRDPDLVEDYTDLAGGLSVDVDHAAHQAGVKGVVDLGNLYARFAALVLSTFGGMQKVNNDFVDRLGGQLRDSNDNVNQLIAALFEHKAKQLELENMATVEERVAAGRTAVAEKAVETIGQAAEAIMISKGLSPNTAKVVKVLGDNPELADAMQDPDIQAMLENPVVVAQLVKLMKQTASEIKEHKQAPQAPQAQPEPDAPTPEPAAEPQEQA